MIRIEQTRPDARALVARVGNCRELVRPREARAEITGDVAAATHPCPFITFSVNALVL
jgi:hypothetical protein